MKIPIYYEVIRVDYDDCTDEETTSLIGRYKYKSRALKEFRTMRNLNKKWIDKEGWNIAIDKDDMFEAESCNYQEWMNIQLNKMGGEVISEER